MDIKEFNKEAKRVFFSFSQAEINRGESALSFDTILSLADRIQIEDKKVGE